MKKVLFVFLVVVVVVGCSEKKANADPTPSASDTVARSEKQPLAGVLPSWRDQLIVDGYTSDALAKLSSATDPQFVDVTFEGPILLATDGPKRAVAVSGHGHVTTLHLPPSLAAADVLSVFPNARCNTADGCVTELDEVSLKLLAVSGAEGLSLISATSNAKFNSTVPHLSPYISTNADLHADVLTTVPPHQTDPAKKVSTAFFDIAHAFVLSTTPNKCRGKLGSGPEQEFAYSSTLRFPFADQAVLHVQTATGTKRLRLHGFVVPIRVRNEAPTRKCEPHFKMFEKVAKHSITLPSITSAKCEICQRGVEVAGCGNTQWP